MTFTFPAPVPEIPVRDVAAAAEYYRKNFGFSLDWGGQEVGLAGISRGKCRMFLADQECRLIESTVRAPSRAQAQVLRRRNSVQQSRVTELDSDERHLNALFRCRSTSPL